MTRRFLAGYCRVRRRGTAQDNQIKGNVAILDKEHGKISLSQRKLIAYPYLKEITNQKQLCSDLLKQNTYCATGRSADAIKRAENLNTNLGNNSTFA